jgi:predicted RNase H-like nuclease (RuvC/YqgF family)
MSIIDDEIMDIEFEINDLKRKINDNYELIDNLQRVIEIDVQRGYSGSMARQRVEELQGTIRESQYEINNLNRRIRQLRSLQ